MLGKHLIKSWSRQQRVIALSSAEAETYGMVACSAELLGVQACARDLGMEFSAAVYTDASAALGIVQRKGIGKVRHLRTQSLWLQEAHATRGVQFEKIDGSRNPSDLFTKHLTEILADRHMKSLCATPEGGRAESAPELSAVDVLPDYLYGCQLHNDDVCDNNLLSICACFDGEAIADQDVAALDHLPTSSCGTTSSRVVSAIGCECGWTVSRKGCQGSPSTQAMQSAMEPRTLSAEARQTPLSSPNGCSCGWTVASCTARAPPCMPLQSGCGTSTMYSARVQAEVESRNNPIRMVGVRDLTSGALHSAPPHIPAEQQPEAGERYDCDRHEVGHEPIVDAVSGTELGVWTLRGDAQAARSNIQSAPLPPAVTRAGTMSSETIRKRDEFQNGEFRASGSAAVRQPRIDGRWEDDDSEGDCQEIAALWENRRALARMRGTSKSEINFVDDTANNGMYSLVVESYREDLTVTPNVFTDYSQSFCFESIGPIGHAQEERQNICAISSVESRDEMRDSNLRLKGNGYSKVSFTSLRGSSFSSSHSDFNGHRALRH